MKQKIKIGNFEIVCLLLNMLTSKIVLNFPRNVAEDAGTAGWLVILIVSIAVYFLFFIITILYKKFQGKDILDIGEGAFGKFGRSITGLLFLFQFLVVVPIVLREFAEDIKIISLTNTPISLVILLFSIGMIIGAFLGIETLVRIHALAVPILAGAFLFILALSVPRFDSSKIAPWLGLGPEVILRKTVSNLSIYSEFFVLFLIIPFLNKKKDYSGIGRYVILISGFFFVVSSLSYLLVFQYPTAMEFFLPMYQLARSIMIGRFIARIESIFILVWASSAFLYLSSGLYFLTYVFQKSFGLKEQKPLLAPFAILIFTLSMVPENLYSTLQIQMQFYRNYAGLITFSVPIILLLISSIRIRKEKKTEVESE